MKGFLKYLDLQETVLKGLACRRELPIDGSKLICRMAVQLKKKTL